MVKTPEEEDDSNEDDEAYFESLLIENDIYEVRPDCKGEGNLVKAVHTDPRLGWGEDGRLKEGRSN